MKVKNIFTNPVHGIKVGEVGELEDKHVSKMKIYKKLGMLEEVKQDSKKVEALLTTESSKSDFGKSNVETLKVFCADNNIEITEDAVKKDILEAIFKKLFEEESKK